jgi:cell fate (sporulation/competence/biofilm development) regulator YlbF (YheA/YmcA/DUF963 family)
MLHPATQDEAAFAAVTSAAKAEALAAAGTFGAALRESPEFAALLAADRALSEDAKAVAAIEAFNSLQAELRVEITTGILQDSRRAELDRLRGAMLAVPSVTSYVDATAVFQAVCRETASVVSAQIGIDLAVNCRSGGCCG